MSYRKRAYLVIAWTPWNERLVEQAEEAARAEIELAVETQRVGSRSPAPFERDDAWWEAVFDASETELKEMADAAARRHTRLHWWQRRQKREALRAYVRVDARLKTAIGLETCWR